MTWRGRYAESGLAGLADLPRSGKPSPLPEALRDRVLELTLAEPPTTLGATHWSSRLLAGALAGEGRPISHATIARIWHRFGVQPWRAQTFTFSTDPQLEAKIRDVVGLYLHPPEKAVVLCVDEKPQIQALERTAPTLPVRPGHPAAASFDYLRHGTTTLFAALAVATGRVTDACTDRHRHQEFLAFLRQVARAYPRRQLHVVVDNLATHKHPTVQAWLARHPRVTLHFTPTSGSWLNLVEAFCSIITRQALRRGNFPTVADLIAAIERFIAAWNDRCRPFTWTKDPDTVIAKATDPRKRKTSSTSVTEHQTVWGLGPRHGRSWVAAQGWALAVEPQTWEAPVIDQRTSVGLDVHARSVVGCGLDVQTGEVLRMRLTPAHEQVIGWLRSLLEPIKVTYEAGPTGFGLARALAAARIECVVAAPSRLLRPSGERVKTDAKDALHRAQLLAVGQVTAVAVPDEETEAAKDLVRARDDVRGELMSARHRVTHLLLRQGIVYSGGTPWTGVHGNRLRSQRFGRPALQLSRTAMQGTGWARGSRIPQLRHRGDRCTHTVFRPAAGHVPAGRSPRVALTVMTPATGTPNLSRGRLLPPHRRSRFSTVKDNAPAPPASALLEITMTALPSRHRAAAPAYYLGRPASFWTAHLSTRRRVRGLPPSTSPRTDRRT